MSASILVATPHAAFGELLRLSLEEQGHYQVRLVQTTREARSALNRSHFQMVIVDSDLQEEPIVPFVLEFMAQQPHIRVVVIPPDNNPNHPSLGGLIPHGYINRPFYLPDLLELANRLLEENGIKPQQLPVEPSVSIPEWLQNSILLQGYLEKQVKNSDAVAALVGNGDKLVAHVGTLPLPAAQEMASVLLRYWDREEKTDLMRFIRLASIKGDYLVYVTEIVGGIVLMMAYEPGIAISQVRPQTRSIAQRMASIPPTGYQERIEHLSEISPADVKSNNGSEPKTAFDIHSLPRTNGSETPHMAHSALLERATEPVDQVLSSPLTDRIGGNGENAQDHASALSESDEDGNAVQEPEVFDLALLLGNVPAPDPGNEDIHSKFGSTLPGFGWVHEMDTPSEVAAAQPDQVTVTDIKTNLVAAEEMDDEILEEADGLSLLGLEPQVDPLSDTRPHVLSTISHIQQFEPVSPALSLLNYTCVLIPRLPQHYLTGELADKLAQWVHQFCLAFGWRLEGISIRPDYLQWTIQVAPSVSPGNLVRIIRQRTSSSIFNTFDHLKIQNPSGDFWAVGYLIVSGSQPPSAQLLRDYITQTRKRQGITRF